MKPAAQRINEAIGDIKRGCSTVHMLFVLLEICGHLLKDIERLERQAQPRRTTRKAKP